MTIHEKMIDHRFLKRGCRMDVEHAVMDSAIALGGVVITYYLTIRLERRKQQIEKARAAHEACLELRKTLADWMNEIGDATRAEGSVGEVRKRLERVFEHDQFQGRVSDSLSKLVEEPLCKGLFRLTNTFTLQAFQSKGQIAMALNLGEFARDYPRHREEAFRSLQNVYRNFQDELNRVIPLLRSNARL
jgi:hypothetical protein